MRAHGPSIKIKLVEETLDCMRQAGYALDKDSIAFVWKAANGEATPEDIIVWTNAMATSLIATPCRADLRGRLAKQADAICLKIDNVSRELAHMKNHRC